MMYLAPDTARSLASTSMAFVAVDQTLVDDALVANVSIIKTLSARQETWSLVRPGEPESDVGLIYRPGESGGDLKHFFHYAHDFEKIAWDAGLPVSVIKKELKVLKKCYDMLNGLSLRLAVRLDEECGRQFQLPLPVLVQKSIVDSIPYSTSTLRGLWYPQSEWQSGAKTHIDRSCITIHLGDEGGALLALSHEHDTKGVKVSPPRGQALVFFGVKILHMTEGRMKPLWHRSTVESGQDRKAMVHFVHGDIGFPVTHSTKVFKEFYANR